MLKPRYRTRVGRGGSAAGYGRLSRYNVFFIAGIFLLLGSVFLLQIRIADDGKGAVQLLEKAENETRGRENLRQLVETEDLEWRSIVNEHGDEDFVGDIEGESNLEDELETERRLNEALENEDEDGPDRFDELETDMDMEDEGVVELEGFSGDVGAWLNEVDELSEMRGEADEDEQSQARDSGEADEAGKDERKGKGHENTSRNELPLVDKNRSRAGYEILRTVVESKGNRQASKYSNQELIYNSQGLKQAGTESGDALGQRVMGKEKESVATSTTGQISKLKVDPSMYLRGGIVHDL